MSKAVYECSSCGAQAPKWAGQCSDCGAWNTLQESVVLKSAPKNPRLAGYAGDAALNQVRLISDISATAQQGIPTGTSELDRVLGGGLVQGSVILIGGDPGIGKSTLLIQTLAQLRPLYPASNRIYYPIS